VELVGLMQPAEGAGETVRSPTSSFRGEADEPCLCEGARIQLRQEVAGRSRRRIDKGAPAGELQ
jgi:hypothetical protein